MFVQLLFLLGLPHGYEVNPADLHRFPSREWVRQQLNCNVEFTRQCEQRAMADGWEGEYWHAAWIEAGYRHRCWDALEDAWQLEKYKDGIGYSGGHWETICRCHLLWLKHLIGDEAYARGQMPLPIPLWACQRMD